MKWIRVEKSKPNFQNLYLVTDTKEPGYVETGNLLRSETTVEGVQHVFKTATRELVPTHIALITDPGKTE